MKRHGFSLVELLLAVFILAIGVIAVAALFPAGIAQQRQSADDIMGPVVANSALSVIRERVRAEDIGTFEGLLGNPPPAYMGITNPGDFAWLRPHSYPDGKIDVFGRTPGATGYESVSIPRNTALYPLSGDPPFAVITQLERYYPMRSEYADPNHAQYTGTQSSSEYYPGQPQYVWDCMFRRFQGQVQVAIFVYRVSLPAGGNTSWVVPPGLNNANAPSLPVSLPLAVPWNAGITVIPGTDAGSQYDPSALDQAWQAPSQWLLDQNNNVHRVLSGRRRYSDGPVELMRPIAALPNVPVYILAPSPQPGIQHVVKNIWYIPNEVAIDTNNDGNGDLPVSLTPVYVTVRDL